MESMLAILTAARFRKMELRIISKGLLRERARRISVSFKPSKKDLALSMCSKISGSQNFVSSSRVSLRGPVTICIISCSSV